MTQYYTDCIVRRRALDSAPLREGRRLVESVNGIDAQPLEWSSEENARANLENTAQWFARGDYWVYLEGHIDTDRERLVRLVNERLDLLNALES